MKLLIVLVALGVIFADDKWFPIKSKMTWDGLWGNWGVEEVCYQTYATRFRVRVESKQGDGDDTALNTVCLICKNGRELCSNLGFWGNWYSSSTCSSGYSGGKFRLEHSQGRGDDTAGNTLLLNCGTGNNYVSASGAPNYWGDWSTRSCPHGSKICGIQTRVEPRIDGDDTALNGIKFTCCATVVKVDAYLKTIYHGDGGSGSSSYTRITRTIETGISSTMQVDNKESLTIATHVGASVNYGAVSGDASIDVGYLTETFKSTINTRSEKKTETREFMIYLNEPTYIYQARSTIVMSDGSTIEQGL